MSNYSPCGEPKFVVAEYKQPEPPKPKENHWHKVALLLFLAFMVFAPQFLEVAVTFRGECYGQLCDSLREG